MSTPAIQKKLGLEKTARDVQRIASDLLSKSFAIEGKEDYSVIATTDLKQISDDLDRVFKSLNTLLHNKIKEVERKRDSKKLEDVFGRQR